MSHNREIAKELTVEALSTQNLITLFWLLCRGEAVFGLINREQNLGNGGVADFLRHHGGC